MVAVQRFLNPTLAAHHQIQLTTGRMQPAPEEPAPHRCDGRIKQAEQREVGVPICPAIKLQVLSRVSIQADVLVVVRCTNTLQKGEVLALGILGVGEGRIGGAKTGVCCTQACLHQHVLIKVASQIL